MNQHKPIGTPLFVTRNGKTEAVVLSPAAFDPFMEQAELAKTLTVLDQSTQDVKAGRIQPLKEAIRDIAKELGLKLSR